jgi:hypothetical protein
MKPFFTDKVHNLEAKEIKEMKIIHLGWYDFLLAVGGYPNVGYTCHKHNT